MDKEEEAQRMVSKNFQNQIWAYFQAVELAKEEEGYESPVPSPPRKEKKEKKEKKSKKEKKNKKYKDLDAPDDSSRRRYHFFWRLSALILFFRSRSRDKSRDRERSRDRDRRRRRSKTPESRRRRRSDSY